jgi:hypothetical protein
MDRSIPPMPHSGTACGRLWQCVRVRDENIPYSVSQPVQTNGKERPAHPILDKKHPYLTQPASTIRTQRLHLLSHLHLASYRTIPFSGVPTAINHSGFHFAFCTSQLCTLTSSCRQPLPVCSLHLKHSCRFRNEVTVRMRSAP